MNRYVTIAPLKMGKNKVLLRHNDERLILLNNFAAEAIKDQYLFDIFLTWCNDPN